MVDAFYVADIFMTFNTVEEEKLKESLRTNQPRLTDTTKAPRQCNRYPTAPCQGGLCYNTLQYIKVHKYQMNSLPMRCVRGINSLQSSNAERDLRTLLTRDGWARQDASDALNLGARSISQLKRKVAYKHR